MRHKPIKSKLFVQNRRRIADRMDSKALAVVNANDILPTNADGTLPMQPNADMFFLTGIEQEESVLVLFPDAADEKQREILFVRQPASIYRFGKVTNILRMMLGRSRALRM